MLTGNILSDRTKQGLAAARKRGQRLGPPPKMTDVQILAAKQEIEAKEASIAEMATLNGVHASTIIRSIRRLEILQKS